MSDIITTIQSNKLVLSRSNFTVPQRRVIEAVIETISHHLRKEITANKSNELSYQPRFDDISTIVYRARDLSSPEHYGELRTALMQLKSRAFFLETEDSEIVTGFILKSEFKKRSETLTLLIDESLYKLCLDLANGFTVYQTKVLLSFSSIYAMKIYELIAKWRNKSHFYLSVDELRRLTDTQTVYIATKDLKKRVLDIAKSQLDASEITDLKFDYKDKKRGKKIVGFDIIIHKTTHAHEMAQKTKKISLRWNFSQELIDNFKKYDIHLVGKNIELVKSYKAEFGERQLAEEIERLHKLADGKDNPVGYIITSLKNQLMAPTIKLSEIKEPKEKEVWEMTKEQRIVFTEKQRAKENSPKMLKTLIEEFKPKN